MKYAATVRCNSNDSSKEINNRTSLNVLSLETTEVRITANSMITNWMYSYQKKKKN